MATSKISSALTKIQGKVARRNPSTVPIELIADTLHTNRGDIVQAAEDLDIRYMDLANYIDKASELRDICLSYRDSLVDKAERNLHEALDSRDWKATRYTLSTLGKERGYVTKTESEITTIEVKAEIDLSQLSVDELKQLDGIMETAQVIDHDPNALD